MRTLTLTKKHIKRLAAIGAAAAAAAAVAITVVVTSVNTHAENRRVPIYRVNRGDNKIAVTFDVAWENSNTDELLQILDENGAKATFFVTGDWCDRYPDDVKKFADAGHEIGNHSDQHPHVEGIAVNDLIDDTKECSRKIEMITGTKPAVYRAPYGEYDDSLLTTIDGMGMKVIQWDVDSVDWKKPTAAEIKDKVLKNTKSGSILLFHNDLENTTEALPEILKTLKEQGFEFVTVSGLVYPDNYTIDASGEQSAAAPASLDIASDGEKLKAVMAQYSEEIKAAGITEEQLAQVVAAIKSGNADALPEELKALAAEVMGGVTPQTVSNDTTNK